LSTLLAISSIYVFIVMGFVAKKVFKDEVDERTLILVSIYFLQPILTFWGLTRAPIDFNIIYTPFLYFIIVTVTLIILWIVSIFIFDDSKDKSIFIASSLIGNTGNLAIPLGIALFGESSIPYTSIINIANIFFIYTIGIYFYAKSSYSLKESFYSIIKIPILWFAFLALAFNYLQIPINEQFNRILEMGAYSTIVIQLMIFGMYLSKTTVKTLDLKLNILVSFTKLIFLPIVGIFILYFSNLPYDIAQILVLSLAVPLAVNNVNIASLYKCKPLEVTNIVFLSSLVFLVLIYFDLKLLEYIYDIQIEL